MRLLVVEDERHLAEALAHLLKKNHYTVDCVYDGEAGLDCALTGIYDVIILDIMLPKLDGIAVLKTIRAQKIETPVILLTAKGEVSDKVRGLDSGADDYLAKPFHTEELLARIRALARRPGDITDSAALSFGDITLQPSTLKLSSGEEQIQLTLKESELLEFLIRRGNMVSPKEQLIEKLWGFDSEAEANHVEVYVSFLRKKLGFVKSSVSISTVRGVGYVLKDSEKEDGDVS